MSADEWTDIDLRAPEIYRVVLAAAKRHGWAARRELFLDGNSQTLVVRLWGTDARMAQVVLKARVVDGKPGTFAATEFKAGQPRVATVDASELLQFLARDVAPVQAEPALARAA